MLVAKGISKVFGPTPVLEDISFELAPGSMTALIGGNGAGKSTLLRILGGVLPPTAGTVTIGESQTRVHSIRSAMRSGIRSAHQEGSLIPAWKVKEHFPSSEGNSPDPWSELAPGVDGNARVETLSPTDRQLLETARALAGNPEVLLADEPAAGLGHAQKDRVFTALSRARKKGCIVLIATHDLERALAECDGIFVLHKRHLSLQAASCDCTLDVVLSAMGAESRQHRASAPLNRNQAAPGLVIRVERTNITFDIRQREIVGVVGGSVAKDLLRVLYGLSNSFEGYADLDSHRLARSPAELFTTGIIYVSRERSSEWSFTGQSVEFNLVAAVLRTLTHASIVESNAVRRRAKELQQVFEISAPSLETDFDLLSGGNRQKSVLARAVAAGPRFLLLDEPFSGVDQPTRFKLFAELRKLADAGTGVLIYSQEVPDILQATDRVILCKGDGTVTEFISEETEPARLETALVMSSHAPSPASI